MSELKWIKEQFILNRKERRAILLLTLIFFFMCFFENQVQSPEANPNEMKMTDITFKNENDQKLNSKTKEITQRKSSKPKLQKMAADRQIQTITPSKTDYSSLPNIDPNQTNKEELSHFKLNSLLVKSWINYLTKGGRFKEARDIKKLYGMTDPIYDLLIPKLIFNKQKNSLKTKKKDIVEINSASADEFEKLRGIGEVLSERIVKFRSSLGGFYKVDQIKEVYGISDSLFEAISRHLELIPVFSKININEASYHDLISHPYIDKKEAKIICRYKLQHGDFNKLNELYQIKNIKKEKLNKLISYLTI